MTPLVCSLHRVSRETSTPVNQLTLARVFLPLSCWVKGKRVVDPSAAQ